tara:strand:+ start:4255 stop:4473 length:219 start_codon:yes stop_codon:yes gene_type:complete
MSNSLRFEYRFKIVCEHAVDFGTWYDWEEIDTVKATEIQALIDRGKTHYQLRVLESRNIEDSERDFLRNFFK